MKKRLTVAIKNNRGVVTISFFAPIIYNERVLKAMKVRYAPPLHGNVHLVRAGALTGFRAAFLLSFLQRH